MRFKKLKTLGTFSGKLNNDCLIQCPSCGTRWGIRKWERLMNNDDGLVCPSCSTVFIKKDTLFMVSYFERPFFIRNSVNSVVKKVVARSIVKSKDNLIRKE